MPMCRKQERVVQMCKLLCEHLDKDGVKDIESAVGAVRSDKVKKEREQAPKDKKGAQALHSRYRFLLELLLGPRLICQKGSAKHARNLRASRLLELHNSTIARM